MNGHAGGHRSASITGSKREARIALVRRSGSLDLAIVFVLRGVKGLEKAFVVGSGEELERVLKQFSAIAIEVGGEEPEPALELPAQLRETVAGFRELLERLSSELSLLVGW